MGAPAAWGQTGPASRLPCDSGQQRRRSALWCPCPQEEDGPSPGPRGRRESSR